MYAETLYNDPMSRSLPFERQRAVLRKVNETVASQLRMTPDQLEEFHADEEFVLEKLNRNPRPEAVPITGGIPNSIPLTAGVQEYIDPMSQVPKSQRYVDWEVAEAERRRIEAADLPVEETFTRMPQWNASLLPENQIANPTLGDAVVTGAAGLIAGPAGAYYSTLIDQGLDKDSSFWKYMMPESMRQNEYINPGVAAGTAVAVNTLMLAKGKVRADVAKQAGEAATTWIGKRLAGSVMRHPQFANSALKQVVKDPRYLLEQTVRAIAAGASDVVVGQVVDSTVGTESKYALPVAVAVGLLTGIPETSVGNAIIKAMQEDPQAARKVLGGLVKLGKPGVEDGVTIVDDFGGKSTRVSNGSKLETNVPKFSSVDASGGSGGSGGISNLQVVPTHPDVHRPAPSSPVQTVSPSEVTEVYPKAVFSRAGLNSSLNKLANQSAINESELFARINGLDRKPLIRFGHVFKIDIHGEDTIKGVNLGHVMRKLGINELDRTQIKIALLPKLKSDLALTEFDNTVIKQSVIDDALNYIYRGKGPYKTLAEMQIVKKKVQQLEQLRTLFRPSVKAPINTPGGEFKILGELVSKGRLTQGHADTLGSLLSSMQKTLAKFPLNFQHFSEASQFMQFQRALEGYGEPVGADLTGGYYAHLDLIDFDAPQAIPHEIGHWVFSKMLTGEERIKFFNYVTNNFYGNKYSGQLRPKANRNQALVNKVIGLDAALVDPKLKMDEGQILNASPQELFAEMFSNYAISRRLSPEEAKIWAEPISSKMHNATRQFLQVARDQKIFDPVLEPMFRNMFDDKLDPHTLGELSKFSNAVDNASSALRQVLNDVVGSEVNFARQLLQKGSPLARSTDPQTVADLVYLEQRITTKIMESLKTKAETNPIISDLFFHIFERRNSPEFLSQLIQTASQKGPTQLRRMLLSTGFDPRPLAEKSIDQLRNQGGFAHPALLAKLGFHVAAGLTGFTQDDDGHLTWDFNRYLKYGGVMEAIYGGGAVYRKLGGPQKVAKVWGSLAKKFFEYTDKNALTKRITTVLHPSERMDPAAYKLKQDFQHVRTNIRRQADTAALEISKRFSKEERVQLSDFIEQEGSWQNASERVQAQAQEIIGWHRQVREMLVDSGMLPEVVNELGDQYLHRVYASKLDKGPYKGFRAKLKAIQAKYLEKRGKTRALTADQVQEMEIDLNGLKVGDKMVKFKFSGAGTGEDRVASATHYIPEHQGITGAQRLEQGFVLTHLDDSPHSAWKVETINKDGSIRMRRDYTRAERTAMGEIRDVALRMAVLMREASNDIALGQMFKHIQGDSRWAVNASSDEVKELIKSKGYTKAQFVNALRDSGWIHVPTTETNRGISKFGALSDHYVHPDVMEVLNSMTKERFNSQLGEILWGVNREFLKYWKTSMTALNPAVHGVNVIGNLVFAHWGGYNPGKVAAVGLREVVSKGQYWDEAVKAGLIDSGIMRTEYDIASFITEAEKITGDAISQATGSVGIVRRTLDFMGIPFKAGLRAYELEDQVFKMGVFVENRMKGKSAKEALDAANELFFDYSQVPKGVAFLRDTGIMPFISWGYKALPVIAKTLRDNPERLVGLIMLGKLTGDMIYEAEYGEDAEQQKEYEQELVKGSPIDKSIFGVTSSLVRLPSDQDSGEARYLDMSRGFPGADLFGNWAKMLPFGGHPLLTFALALAQGEKDDKKLRPFDSPKTEYERFENIRAYSKFFVRSMLPNLPVIPGSYNYENVMEGLASSGVLGDKTTKFIQEEMGYTGLNSASNKINLGEKLLGMLGPKIQRMDIDNAEHMRQVMAEKHIKDAEKNVVRTTLSPRSNTQKVDRAFEGLHERMDYEFKELDRLDQLRPKKN